MIYVWKLLVLPISDPDLSTPAEWTSAPSITTDHNSVFNTSISKNTLDNTARATTLRISGTYTTESMKSKPTGTSITPEANNQRNTGTGATAGRSVDVSRPEVATYHPLTGGDSTMPTWYFW